MERGNVGGLFIRSILMAPNGIGFCWVDGEFIPGSLYLPLVQVLHPVLPFSFAFPGLSSFLFTFPSLFGICNSSPVEPVLISIVFSSSSLIDNEGAQTNNVAVCFNDTREFPRS